MATLVRSGAIVSAFAAHAPEQQAAMPAERAPKDWLAVLKAFATHDAASQRVVDEAANHADDPNTQALAAMLQKEWDFHSNAEALARPRQVFMPKLPVDLLAQAGASAESESFTFDITIGPEGLVTSAEFRSPPRQPALGAIARTRVLHALYRPVFDGREFASFPAAVSMTIEIK